MGQETRKMTETEREYLLSVIENYPKGFKKFSQGFQNIVVIYAASMAFLIVIWLLVAWLVKLVSDVDIGIKSNFSIWIVLVFTILSLPYSISSTIKWLNGWKDNSYSLTVDLEAGVVIEESYEIVSSIRFIEIEHGSSLFFFKTASDKVIALYDEGSFTGGYEEDSSVYTLEPKSHLKIVRLPVSRYMIREEFSGTVLELERELDLLADSEKWPEDGEIVDILWADLEKKYS